MSRYPRPLQNYLSGGYGIRLAIEARDRGWSHLRDLATIWQPSRLKGIQVTAEYGTPFLAATQMLSARPLARKYLSLDRTEGHARRFVRGGTILVTCSGNVGRCCLARAVHGEHLVSHDLLRVEPQRERTWGWLYAYLRSPQARAMMTAARYGHIIKHLEVDHLGALPIPELPDSLLGEFNDTAMQLLDMRNRTDALFEEAEQTYADSIGVPEFDVDPETGFVLPASRLFGGRRRLEAAYHSPSVEAILKRVESLGLRTDPLSEVTECVWWMNRFKRVFGENGAPYMSADELFSLNPTISKRVMLEQADNADDFLIRAGWIIMARSGQVYGLNGSVALMTAAHESVFLSDDFIRIIPRSSQIRPGYLLMTLAHPRLGRPLVIRNAYGTSIPHLDPADVSEIPVVRMAPKTEAGIADMVEEAAELRSQADRVENDLTTRAEATIDRFIEGAATTDTVTDADTWTQSCSYAATP